MCNQRVEVLANKIVQYFYGCQCNVICDHKSSWISQQSHPIFRPLWWVLEHPVFWVLVQLNGGKIPSAYLI
jgi:hypothetical protein